MMLAFCAALHADEIEAIAWSPSGEEVLARIWSASDREAHTVLTRPRSGVSVTLAIPGTDLGFVWADPGAVLLSGSDGTFRADLRTAGALPMLARGAPHVALDPAGTTLTTWSPEEGTAWWVAEPCRPKRGETRCDARRWIPRADRPRLTRPVHWLPDGGWLVDEPEGSGWSLVRYAADGTRGEAVGLPAGPARVDVARDGTWVAWLDARVSDWVVRGRLSGAGPGVPAQVEGAVSAVDLSDDGSLLVVGTPRGELRATWTDGSGRAQSTPGHVRVRAVAASPEGTEVAADVDGTLGYWRPVRAPTPGG